MQGGFLRRMTRPTLTHSMMWRAISARPYQGAVIAGPPAAAPAAAHAAAELRARRGRSGRRRRGRHTGRRPRPRRRPRGRRAVRVRYTPPAAAAAAADAWDAVSHRRTPWR